MLGLLKTATRVATWPEVVDFVLVREQLSPEKWLTFEASSGLQVGYHICIFKWRDRSVMNSEWCTPLAPGRPLDTFLRRNENTAEFQT